MLFFVVKVVRVVTARCARWVVKVITFDFQAGVMTLTTPNYFNYF